MPTREPQLGQLLRRAIDNRVQDIATCDVGTVVAFSNGKADIQLAVRRPILDSSEEIVYEGIPVLPDVPVVVLGTTRSFIQVPVQPGDRVLVIFTRYSPAEFIAGQTMVEPGDSDAHSLSNGFAIPLCLPDDAVGGVALALATKVKAKLDAIIETLESATAPAGGGPVVYETPPPTDTDVAAAEVLVK